MVIAGIDSGLEGWIVLNKGFNNLSFYKIPTLKIARTRKSINIKELIDFFKSNKIDLAIMEKLTAFAKGRVAVFTLGKIEGIFETIFKMLGINYHLVYPNVWKKYFKLQGKLKKHSTTLARQYTSIKIKNHHQAEAFLLTVYARNNL